MKTFKKALPVVGALVWALLLLPFFLGAEAAHPATDDFTFAVYTHPTWVQTGSILHVLKDALSYTLRTWRDWQGTVTGVLMMTLNPAVFSLEHYGGHVFVLLGLILIGTRVFLQHFLQKRLNLPWRAAFAALSAAQLLFLPDIVEGVYWFNGAWFYMGAQAVALMTLALGDSLSERPVRGAGTILAFALCWALLFALGMDNYITAMMTAAALLMLALWRAAAHARAAAVRTAMMLLPIGVGLLISVIAPGNSVRMAADGAHEAWLSAGRNRLDAARRGEIHPALHAQNAAFGAAAAGIAGGEPTDERARGDGGGPAADRLYAAGRLSDALRDDYPAHVFLRVRGVGARHQHVSQLCAAVRAGRLHDGAGARQAGKARGAGGGAGKNRLLRAGGGGAGGMSVRRSAPQL